MPAFMGPDDVGSNEAAHLLHPSAGHVLPASFEAMVLADISGGLAASVNPDHLPGPEAEVLLTTSSYEAVVVTVPADGAVTFGADGQAAAFTVVSGSVLVWTADDGCDLVDSGASCAIGADERVRVANFGQRPALLVVARTLSEATGSRQWPPMSTWNAS